MGSYPTGPSVTPSEELTSNLEAIRRKIKELGITRRDVKAQIRRVRMSRKKA